MMRHIINGVPVNLRELTERELSELVYAAEARIAKAKDDKEKLLGERIRRSRTVFSI